MAFRNYHSFSTAVRRRAMPHGFDSMFGWTLFIFLLIGFTLFCWMGSFYVFGHPEKAANYHLLKRLHKLEEPQRFQMTAAPRGEFLKPLQLSERFATLTPMDIKRLNEKLLRNFLRNYHQTRELVPYATGNYKILTVVPLTQKNIFYPGVVALLQSLQQPEIFLEQVFTSNAENLPALQASLIPGQEIKLEKPLDLSAIIFMEQLRDGGLQFTTMPLLYGTYGNQESGQATFSLEPPETINIEGGLPILSNQEVESARYLASSSLTKNPLESEKTSLKNGESIKGLNAPLVRIATEKTTLIPAKPSPVAQKIPQAAPQAAPLGTPQPSSPSTQKKPQETQIAKAIPVATSAAPPTAIPASTPALLPAISINTPPASREATCNTGSELTPSSPATPQPATSSTPSTIVTAAVPLPTASPTPAAFNFSSSIVTAAQPVSSENTNPSLPPTTTTHPSSSSSSLWPLYEPGKMPRGRIIDPTEFSALADQGFTGERLYIQGDFAVTASGEHRAVLRYQSAVTDLPIGLTGKIRIIADYPQGTIPPTEGTSLAQDRLHPLMITDIKKEKDGTVDLYVHAITK